jgi:hypothetical protein
MRMFEDNEYIGEFIFHSPFPELMLKIPGLFIARQAQI